jgi:hypothetical protein
MNLQFIRQKQTVELREIISHIDIEIIKSDLKLYKLHDTDFLPRYNFVLIKITNRTRLILDNLLLRIERLGSTIGKGNFDVLPIKTYNLLPNDTGKYELKIFDPFNEKFNSMKITVADERDWSERTKVDKWLNQAGDFSRRIK